MHPTAEVVSCSLCVRFQLFQLFKWMKAYWESRRISLESFKKHCAIKCNTFCFSSFGRYSVRSVTLKQPRIASKTKTEQCSKVLLIKTISSELKSFQKTTIIVKFITPLIDHSRGSSKGALILIHVINNVACLFQKPNQKSPGFTSFGFLRSLSIQSLKVKPSRR